MKNRQQRKKSDSLGPVYKDMLTITPTAFGDTAGGSARNYIIAVSYTHLRAHET